MIQSGKKSFKGRGENPGILSSTVLRMQSILFTGYIDGTTVNAVGCLTEDPCPCGQVTAGHMKSLCQIWKSRSEVQSVTVRKSMDKWKVPSESPLVLALLSSHPLSSQLVTLMTNSSPSLPLDTWLLTLEVEAYLSCASPSGTYLVASRESSSHPLTPHPPLPTL